MSVYAIISDIHANLEALEVVLADIEDKGISRILCLGDIIGYGPDPAECANRVRSLAEFSLIGNHDIAAIYEPVGFNPLARDAAFWTKKQMEPGRWTLPWSQKRKNWDYIRNAPETQKDRTMLYVHASPRDPIAEYVEAADCKQPDSDATDKIVEIFEMIEGLCFLGHTHRPGVITADMVFHKPADIDHRYDLSDEKAIVNVGSVGQPRDGDPRACYVTVTPESIHWHRLEYNIDRTNEKIRNVNMLDDRLGERLYHGV